MSTLYDRQLELENDYSTSSIVAGQQAILDAFSQGRVDNIGTGKLILAKAFEASLDDFKEYLKIPTTGIGGKYKALLKIAPPDVLVMAGLREVLNGCADVEPTPLQSFLTRLGRVIESESMLVVMERVSDVYTQRTVEYLDSAGTRSISHRYRTFLKGAERMSIEWDSWTVAERTGVAKLLLSRLYDSTGLFKWHSNPTDMMYYLEPSDTLREHFTDIQEAARAVVKYPPMLIPPMSWKDQYDGGYLTEWFRHHAPMCGMRFLKREHKSWMLNILGSPTSQPVRSAMDKAQCVPYRVNSRVLAIARHALSMRVGILGLPSFISAPKPAFPLEDGWQKDEASEAELDTFNTWKSQMAFWYTQETKRRGRHVGILSRINELLKYEDEVCLYFPTFIDWRGRMYFRSNLNPQSSDVVKGCLEFAEGKRLGHEGLRWLKAHVANCCGFDKHDLETKIKWCDDNWHLIENFLDNPYDVDSPEADTSFTLLQAGYALQDALALPNPEEYICHVPVAMDATCSGLQHLSALMRDPVGAYHTNLFDNQEDQKSDIYMHVASEAVKLAPMYIDNILVKQFWEQNAITRAMAKNPVMTYVYGATLINCIQGIALGLAESGIEPIKGADGNIIYSLNALSTPIAKALREGVVQTVPVASEMMKYLQNLVRAHREHCMQWVTPVGVPVINWAEGTLVKRVNIRSMGIEQVVYAQGDRTYNTRSASNGIVPNFVHSLDSSHLCMTINAFNGRILPIHDSFATHACDVSAMHKALRATFVTLYSEYKIESFLESNGINTEDFPPPIQGDFKLDMVHKAPFMFC